VTDLEGLASIVPTNARPVAARMTVYDRLDGAILASWGDRSSRLLSASTTYDLSRLVRRQTQVALQNADGSLSPRAPGDLLHTGAVFALDRAVGRADFRRMGTFVVASFAAGMDGRLSLRGEDPLSLLVQPFGEPVVIAAGTSCEDALRALWAPVLDPSGDGEGWDLDSDGRTVPLRVFLPDEDRLSAVVTFLAAQGLDVYADRLGRPRMRPTVDPGEAAVTVVRGFRPGDGGTLMDLERSGSRRAYNRVRVESSAPDRAVVGTTLDVTDTASPLHASRIGVQAAPIFRSAEILDQAAATSVARRLLREYAQALDTVSGEAVPDESLDEGDVVTFDEHVSGADDRYRLERVTHPVAGGDGRAMSLEASRVVSLYGAAA
jgi:hypothetical protein